MIKLRTVNELFYGNKRQITYVPQRYLKVCNTFFVRNCAAYVAPPRVFSGILARLRR